MFKLGDIFEVQGTRYKVDDVDPYGRRLMLAETSSPATKRYLKALSDRRASEREHGQLDPSFWNLELRAMDGGTIELRQLKGQYILLNFWGEWSAPCLEEIPTLRQVDSEYGGGKLQIIGMLQTNDLEAANEVMEENEMTWPQVRLTEELAERFSIQGFPTNLLILPGGEKYIRASHVTSAFFDQTVR